MTENDYLALAELITATATFDIERYIDEALARITKTYTAEYQRLYALITSESYLRFNPSNQATRQDVTLLINQLEAELKHLDETVIPQVEKELEGVYVASALFYVKIVQGISETAGLLEALPFETLNDYLIKQLLTETADDLLFATKHVNKEVKKTIHDIFAKNLQLHALNGTSYKSVIKSIEKELTSSKIKKQFLKQGFTGIIDAKGRRWNLSTYTRLVVTTKLQEAYHAASKTEGINRGYDLAQISTHGATDSCAQFEGMIISMNGLTEGYLTYDALKATGLIFHPNCRHTCYPLRDFDSLRKKEKRHHEEQMSRVLTHLKM